MFLMSGSSFLGNLVVIYDTVRFGICRKRKLAAFAGLLLVPPVSSFPECENFIAHYLLGCDEVTDDLLGAKTCVSTANIFILLCCSLPNPL